MNKLDELQKLCDLLDEKILHLREAKIREANHLVRFQLNKEIEEAEAERCKIIWQIENVDTLDRSQELYRALMKLGYRKQVGSFLKFLKAQSVGAFLIHGAPDYGQRWLLNRLVTQHIRLGTIGKVVRIELNRIGRRRDIRTLWRELSGRVGLRKEYSPPDIAERVFHWWETQNVIFVFHDVDCMPEGYLQELLQNFWFPLVNQGRKVVSQTQFQLLMFLVDYEGSVGHQHTLFVKHGETWEPKIPIKLPPITPFSTNVLTDWIETVEIEFDTLPLEVQIVQTARQTFRRSEEISDNYLIINSEYFPVTNRQMKQIWRYLRRPLREGAPTELDVEATVNQIGCQGLLLELVLVPCRTNRAELLLLIDQDGSMVPFHALSHRLVETALRGGCIGKASIYYFHNCPTEYLYHDPNHQQAELVKDIVTNVCSHQTSVLIFSDAGAARNGYSRERYELTREFLVQLKQRVRYIAWLNPMPSSRWLNTTASEIACLLPMFEISRRGMQDAINVLRGRARNSEGRRL
jgi:inactive STAND